MLFRSEGSKLAIYNLGLGPQGYPGLRQFVADRCNRIRGMNLTIDDIMIVTGSIYWLLLLVRGTSLSVVLDPSITGSFIGELKNVTVRQALALILQPLGLDYAVDGSFIRVFRRQPETRLFEINYVAATRAATSSAGRRGDEIGRAHV